MADTTGAPEAPAFNLIVDSCCELPRQLLEEHDVRLVRFTYSEAGKPDGGLCGVDDLFESRSAHDFYQAMRAGAAPMTSQPSPGEFGRVFAEAAETGLPSVYLCFSSGLSGCYEGALAALETLRAQRADAGLATPDFHILDTRLASSALSLYVLEAICLRDSGVDAPGLLRWARGAIAHVHILFMVDSLDALARGGRIPRGAAMVGSALGVRPMLTIGLDGKLKMDGMARGRRKAMRRFVDALTRSRGELAGAKDSSLPETVVIGNADCPEDASALAGMLRDAIPGFEPTFTSVGTTIGCHVGPGMLACCWWGPARGE
jgi:DegV family protein with EDD domain